MSDDYRRYTRTSIIITVIAAGSKILGFLRDLSVAYVFGMGAETDALNTALRVITTAHLFLATYLTTTFVPVYVKTRQSRGDEEAARFTGAVITFGVMLSVVFLAVLQIAAPAAVWLGAPGYDPGQREMTVTALRVLLFELPFLALASLFSGYLTARKSFYGPNMVAYSFNIIICVLCFVFGTKSGVKGLAAANLIGVMSQAVFLAFWLPREKFRLRISFDVTPEIKESVVLLIPVLLGGAIGDLNSWVDGVFASALSEGSVSAIAFSMRLSTMTQGLFVMPIAGVMFAVISEYVAKGNIDGVRELLWRNVKLILFIIIPLVAIALPQTLDVVRVIYERGGFDAEDSLMTNAAFRWLLPSFIPIVIHVFAVRVFYALKDTKTPMICGVISVAVNASSSALLVRVMGIGGVALGTTIGHFVTAVLLILALKRRLVSLELRSTAVDALKMSAGALLGFTTAAALAPLFADIMPVARLAACSVSGVAVYLIATLILKETVVWDAIRAARGGFGGK